MAMAILQCVSILSKTVKRPAGDQHDTEADGGSCRGANQIHGRVSIPLLSSRCQHWFWRQTTRGKVQGSSCWTMDWIAKEGFLPQLLLGHQ